MAKVATMAGSLRKSWKGKGDVLAWAGAGSRLPVEMPSCVGLGLSRCGHSLRRGEAGQASAVPCLLVTVESLREKLELQAVSRIRVGVPGSLAGVAKWGTRQRSSLEI